MSKVLFFVLYFGILPNTFQYWLNSCGHNTDFNWIVFTDDTTQYNYPANVEVCYTTLPEIIKIIEAKTNTSIEWSGAYKLCDIRPLFAFLFDEYLSGYTHWGYCDLDILIGRLNHFISEDMLQENDKINLFGHLSIIKNDTRINTIFQKCDYKRIITSQKSCTFDELYFSPNINTVLKQSGFKVLDTIPLKDIGSLHYNFHTYYYVGKKKNKKAKYTPNIFQYKDGCIFNYYIIKNEIKTEEIAYIHFQQRKIEVIKPVLVDYLLVPNKIIPCVDVNTHSIMEFSRDNYAYTLSQIWKRAIRKIKNDIKV